MPVANRSAKTSWEGALAAGEGAVHADTGAFGDLPVTWAVCPVSRLFTGAEITVAASLRQEVS